MFDAADDRREILILEDDARRRDAMAAALADRFPQYPVQFFVAATEMIHHLEQAEWERVIAIGLDHDLELLPDGEHGLVDPGTGRDVANVLARGSAVCPVVIHTTNGPAGTGMQAIMEEAGWDVRRVVPYGDLEWINETWSRSFRDAIVGSVLEGAARG